MNAMFTVGGLIGALGCSYVAEWLGRKKAVLTSCVIMVLGGGLQSGSVQAGMFIFSRFLTGVLGTASAAVRFRAFPDVQYDQMR